MKKLTDTFNEASVARGEVFAIELPNAAFDGGYTWDLQVTSGKAELIAEHEISTPRLPGSEITYPGAGLKEVFLYRAQEEGPLKIEAALKRSWEGDKPPLKTQAFTLTVG